MIQHLNNDNLIYAVKIKDDFYYQEPQFRKTVVNQGFSGFLITCSHGQMVFELKDTRDLIIIPYQSVLWMAPTQHSWDECRKKGEKNAN